MEELSSRTEGQIEGVDAVEIPGVMGMYAYSEFISPSDDISPS